MSRTFRRRPCSSIRCSAPHRQVRGFSFSAGAWIAQDLSDPQYSPAQPLVGALTIASSEFALWWKEHRVYQRTLGDKRFRHSVVGEFTVPYETVTMPGDPEQSLFLYTTAPGSPSRDPMNLLASWTLDRSAGSVPRPMS